MIDIASSGTPIGFVIPSLHGKTTLAKAMPGIFIDVDDADATFTDAETRQLATLHDVAVERNQPASWQEYNLVRNGLIARFLRNLHNSNKRVLLTHSRLPDIVSPGRRYIPAVAPLSDAELLQRAELRHKGDPAAAARTYKIAIINRDSYVKFIDKVSKS